jgi:hypothetical protein
VKVLRSGCPGLVTSGDVREPLATVDTVAPLKDPSNALSELKKQQLAEYVPLVQDIPGGRKIVNKSCWKIIWTSRPRVKDACNMKSDLTTVQLLPALINSSSLEPSTPDEQDSL